MRDWSAEGKSERDALFPPILEALKKEFPERDGPEPLDVLVPGCGLARLAYEIASLGFSVEANDCESMSLIRAPALETDFRQQSLTS